MHRFSQAFISAMMIWALLVCELSCRRKPAPPPPVNAATTAPATQQSATAAATEPAFLRGYLDVVEAHYSNFPATQPLSDILDLPQSAHFTFTEPIYLSPLPRAELWITRADAPPMDEVLREAIDPQANIEAHIVDRQVLFVDWLPEDSGDWKPFVICKGNDATDEIWSPDGKSLLKRKYDYRWASAFAWNQLVVVPTGGGISVLDLRGKAEEAHFDFPNTPGAAPIVPQALTDLQGILAWTPWEPGNPSSGQAARFLNGKWTPLSVEAGWPGKLVHVVPLLDGSALQLLGTESGAVKLAVATLDKIDVDEAKIAAIVDQLNDAEEAKRNDAFEQLTRYGPGIWPILEKLAPDQPPEAAERLERLLHDKIEPSLGGMKLLGGKSLTVAARLMDGGAVFYAPDGVEIPAAGNDSTSQVPAWISVRPGEPIELLPPVMVADLKPGTARIWAVGDDWIVRSEIDGPQRFVGNGFVSVLRKDESAFDELVGIDRRGRWVLRKSSATTNPAADNAPAPTLVIDPTLPDPMPRLPAWAFTTADSVGWDKAGWPVVKRVSAYALAETDWRLLESNERMFSGSADAAVAELQALNPATHPTTAPTDVSANVPTPAPTTLPTVIAPAATATTLPTTLPATLPTTMPSLGPPILLTSDGTRYYDGQTSLHSIDRGGREIVWPLPAIATGHAAAHLVQTPDGRLYLFNQGGRILRIHATPGQPEPYEIEATFTHDVPDTDNLTRMWLDPAGRIDIEWDKRLAITFPAGYIPRPIAEKMLNQAGAN